MAMEQSTRLAVQAELRLGKSVKEVAEKFDVKSSTVYTIKQKLDEERTNELVTAAKDVPAEVLHKVVEDAKSLKQEVTTVVAGIDGLKKLDMSFQTTMTNVLSRFDELLLDRELALKDIVTISNTTANAYEKVFSSGTNIHIGDNNTQSNTKLTVFKNKMGV